MLSGCSVNVQNCSVHIRKQNMLNLSGSINDPRFDSLKQPIFQVGSNSVFPRRLTRENQAIIRRF